MPGSSRDLPIPVILAKPGGGQYISSLLPD